MDVLAQHDANPKTDRNNPVAEGTALGPNHILVMKYLAESCIVTYTVLPGTTLV